MMNKFKDHSGKESMMRRITWLIVVVSLLWGSADLAFNFFFPDFDIHETLILTTLSIGVTGKGVQSIIENKKTNES